MLRLILTTMLAIEPATDPRSVARDVATLLDQGDADGARARIESATAANPDPRFVYMRAALEEHVGRCDRAIPLYQRFLEAAADPLDRAEAEGGLERCGAPTPVPDPTPAPPPEPAVRPSAPQPADLPSPDASTPWQRDALGWTLVGIGAAGGVAGGVVLGLADAAARSANDSAQQSAYENSRRQVRPRRVGGAVALSAGTALLVGGIVRFVVVKRRGSTRTASFGGPLRF